MYAFARHILFITLSIGSMSVVAGFRDDAPPITDPYTGLLPASALQPGDKGPIKDAANKRLAIVLSGNSNAHLKWSDEAASVGREGLDRFFGTLVGGNAMIGEQDKQIAQAYRAQAITAVVLQPLVDSFKEVKVMNDFAEFRDSGFDLVVLMDITFVNTFFDSWVFVGSKYETGTSVKAHFVTSGFQLGPVVEVEKRQVVERDEFWEGVIATRKFVFAQYVEAMQKVVGVGRKTQTATPTGAAPTAATAEHRLRQINQLQRDGLISEDEAIDKRKQILHGM